MSYNLVLNSSNVVQGTFNNTYQYSFINGNFDVPEDSEISVSSITIPYSWVNVSAALGNNVIGYAVPSSTTQSAYYSKTLPDGFYTVNDLNNELHKLMFYNGHYWALQAGGVIQYNSTNIVYPLSLVYNTTTYTTAVQSIAMPHSTDIVNVFGASWAVGNNNSGTAWSYPADAVVNANNLFSFLIPQTVTTTTGSLGFILGFTGANSSPSNVSSGSPPNGTFYPSIGQYLAIAGTNPKYGNYLLTTGNSLTTPPYIPPLGSQVNSIVVRCNLVSNDVTNTTDILDSFPITSTYGSNINYQPQIDHWMKMKAGRHNKLVLYFADQNLNPLIMLDNNILVTLMIKLPKKK